MQCVCLSVSYKKRKELIWEAKRKIPYITHIVPLPSANCQDPMTQKDRPDQLVVGN